MTGRGERQMTFARLEAARLLLACNMQRLPTFIPISITAFSPIQRYTIDEFYNLTNKQTPNMKVSRGLFYFLTFTKVTKVKGSDSDSQYWTSRESQDQAIVTNAPIEESAPTGPDKDISHDPVKAIQKLHELTHKNKTRIDQNDESDDSDTSTGSYEDRSWFTMHTDDEEKQKEKNLAKATASGEKKNEEKCHRDKECLSGRCSNKTCQSKLGCAGTCDAGADCASGKCNNGKCAECSYYKFCFDNNVNGAVGAGTHSKYDVSFITDKMRGAPQHFRKEGDHHFCSEYHTTTNDVVTVEMYFVNMHPLLMNQVTLFHNERLLRRWGDTGTSKGFCMSRDKDDYKHKKYGKLCDRKIQFFVKSGKAYGDQNKKPIYDEGPHNHKH
jgi:hypothetical protein